MDSASAASAAVSSSVAIGLPAIAMGLATGRVIETSKSVLNSASRATSNCTWSSTGQECVERVECGQDGMCRCAHLQMAFGALAVYEGLRAAHAEARWIAAESLGLADQLLAAHNSATEGVIPRR